MNKKFLTDIKNLRTAIDTNKLVVLAGSGISIDAGIPSWKELINEMKSEIDVPNDERDYLRIAQMYFNERQQKEFIEKIRSILQHKKIKYNEIHEEIFKLNPEHILTTNFDDLLDQVIKKESLPFSIVSKDQEFPYALNTNLLVKVHGDLANTDIVIKEDDYIDYSLNHPLIEAFIKSVFASKLVLFIGYSFSDIDLKMIVQTVRNILGKDFQNAYLLSTEKKYHPTQREYLKNKGIVVINYYDADENETNYIKDYLNRNNALRENYFREGTGLTKEGQHLLNFITFVASYDKFNEPLTEKNFIDQIYLSLNRFSEFKSLPPQFIANLFPFNISKNYVHNYESYSLKTKNRKLYDLFFEQVELVNGEIIFKPESLTGLSDDEINSFKKKLKEIISFLNYSLIFYLVKEIGPDSIGNYGWSNEKKELRIKQPIICHCLNCSYERLEFSDVIKNAYNLTIGETTSVRSDLALAYAHYKLGNFNQSLKFFEEVANKAWQQGKFFSYYIAKHNRKTLRNLFELFETNLTEEERKKVIKKLDAIDLDKLLFQIPFIGETEYKLLKYIRDDNDVLNNAEKEINGLYEKTLEYYNKYLSGRSWNISGPYYPGLIQLELNKIITFHINNHIVIDEYSNFTRICKKAIEALLISFATHADYKQKLQKIDDFFFNVAILYGIAEETKAVINEYSISELIVDKEDLYSILRIVNNFLKSFFKVNRFSGKAEKNITTENQVNHLFFGDKCRRIFSNIFLLLSKIELEEEIAKELINNLLSFIENESFLYWMNIQYLTDFIFKNHNLFSKENLERLLRSTLYKLKNYNQDNKLIDVVAFIFKENNLQKISDKDLIFNIYNLNKKVGENRHTIIDLWRISDDTIKAELKSKIDEVLNTKFDSDLYMNAVLNDIIDYGKYFGQYIDNINKTKGSRYNLIVGKPAEYSHIFISAMFFVYKIKIESNDERLKVFTNLSDYMQFYISPETFDYSKFKVEWIYMAHDLDVFHERFAKIPQIKEAIKKELKAKFEEELGRIYIKYYT